MPAAERPSQRVCVFLLQLGAPETLADIEPFLYNLLSDVFPAPEWLRPTVARFFARRRAPRVAPLYEEIGGGSPLRKNTEAQAEALERELCRRGLDGRALICMRYAPPRASDVLEEARRSWSDATWVALPLYPQYSFTTTRSSLDELYSQLTTAEQTRLVDIPAYPESPPYLTALAECIDEGLERFSAHQAREVPILFSAHSLPEKFVRRGDPYPEQVAKTIAGVVERLSSSHPVHLGYQSKLGPVRWLEPATETVVRDLGHSGTRQLLVVPVSFVSEHLETLHELDIQLAQTARQAGIDHFERAATPGTRPSFITALADLVEHALPRPSLPPGAEHTR